MKIRGFDSTNTGRGMLLGAAVASLPPTYETVVVAGSPYYYANGVYYVKSGSQYTVATAPVGATVEHPPAQVTSVYVDDENLGYSNGAYYKQEPPAKTDGKPTYKVVAPPMGATVPSVPKGAKKSTVGDVEYYEYAGTHYQVFHSGSKIVYAAARSFTWWSRIRKFEHTPVQAGGDSPQFRRQHRVL